MLFGSVLFSISCFRASGKLAGSAIPAEALKYFGQLTHVLDLVCLWSASHSQVLCKDWLVRNCEYHC